MLKATSSQEVQSQDQAPGVPFPLGLWKDALGTTDARTDTCWPIW